ncbi:ABC transporter ATP-binding protein [Pandoraea nosoerga]|uniref:ABC transporter ATP-binding protein n=1 Tax=Pandoraea nosoerga TaxID=2508296 RepID=A0A5E4SI77_9BURK|nr:ABC transporter ATP-binding protein [Pandoraea nosoerga]MBN4665366.1 ABC transporter ATP-binding protein [Pandoraea nosoerga]MBN4674766.1 ABC transporter ATP-binding protein [Pandoraea nosoerga]MBN4680656.1 ABC transporter ATP-binding protein [Pandoraea nosoerga]MBN4744060.1 ABC transporter ATP-binding protein [Pandoraea nosoerga]VVD73739.1 ABC transporter ATP-binding protein [Pandoraea nosoerga]
MLELIDVRAGYGGSRVLHGVTMRVAPGEIVALLGRNGAGRSTLARAIMGQLPRQGEIRWHGRSLSALAPHEIARLGIGYVPETRDVFGPLTVAQNLLLGQRGARVPAISLPTAPAPGVGDTLTLSQAFERFEELAPRRDTPAGALSGGEQQLLSLCRAMMAGPGLLIVDEPTEGLAPRVVARIGRILTDLRATGVAILLIEQKLTLALGCAQRVAVMGRGTLVFEGAPQALAAAEGIRREWLEV